MFMFVASQNEIKLFRCDKVRENKEDLNPYILQVLKKTEWRRDYNKLECYYGSFFPERSPELDSCRLCGDCHMTCALFTQYLCIFPLISDICGLEEKNI